MTRSNINIILSNGKKIFGVADSSSAPEQGYIVENFILPLLNLNNSEKEKEIINKYLTVGEKRINSTYRYDINLQTKEVKFFEEDYNYKTDRFIKGKDVSFRYTDYVSSLKTVNVITLTGSDGSTSIRKIGTLK